MYAHGRGVAKDPPEAVKWFRKSADLGDAQAQFNLGVMYAHGQGLAKDYAKALAWWNIASKINPGAARNRDLIEKQMSPQQVDEAQKRTKELQALIGARSN